MRPNGFACGLALSAFLVLLPSAAGFSSLSSGESPHEKITEEGAKAAGYPAGGLESLRRAVIAPDEAEFEWDPKAEQPKRIDADGSFRPEHHCDRVPPADSRDAFDATVAYVLAEIGLAVNESHADEPAQAVRHLGRALHAAQDCSSHSNAVDLGAAVEQAYPRAILGEEEPPEGLMLTGFLPGADDPEDPEGDPYPHGRFAKDSADANAEAKLRLPDNRTKYEVARAMAVATTQLVVERFLAQLGPDEVDRLADVEPPGGPLPDVDVPALPLAGTLAVLALLAATVRKRHR